MNILYIASSFIKKGSASVRNIALVNGLAENGHSVDVLTQFWPEEMTDNYFLERVNKKVNIYYDQIKIINKFYSFKDTSNPSDENIVSIVLRSKIFKVLKESIKYLYYYPEIDKEWIKNYNKDLNFSKYDIIISSSDTKTSHFVAANILKLYRNASWFQYWGDPWFDDAGTKGFRKIRAYFSEKYLLSKGDKIFYSSLPTQIAMTKRYKDYSNKMFYLPRAYLNEVVGGSVVRDNIMFTYTGSIYYGRNINPLIKSIENYNKTSDKKIILNIYGIYDDKTKDFLERVDFVKLHGHISYKGVIEVTSKSDVLIFLGNMDGSHQIPGKLYDYFGTNKVILALLENIEDEVGKFIKETNRCTVFKNNVLEINLKEAVDEIGKQQVLEEYSGKFQATRLLNQYTKSRCYK
ncbi:hypothetical protein IEC97_11370 [Neobacillus cucumis]|uniref:hypothetical protein n=1 Tax=Neobacillus cucumis TaxID=1740721 RepID=UPI0018DFDD2D|nr:hypothetical protein [Neobacillus cucumis]MBI0577958.1 hypothetical protein [Neobacillus cucumis]